MFSQRNEETFILKSIGKGEGNGFLDIGAYDGVLFSNTRRLALRGWSGVCFEPSPIPFIKLKELYKDNDKVQTFPIAIGELDGKQSFYDSRGDAISSFDKKHVNVWKAHADFHKIFVDTITVESMFNRFGYDFDFINIDTEGTSVDILLKFRFPKLKNLKLICIEHDYRYDEIMRKIKPFHFHEIMRNGENLILERK